MAAPSYLPSAVAVANECYDKWSPIEDLDPALRDDVDALAGHFYANHEFEKVFINRLVPWNKLAGTPNLGHIAIGDFLVCRAAAAALSANFDPLIETWAFEKKVAMRGALDGLEAINFANVSSPLVKFHGCMQGGREQTVWIAGQLNEPDMAARIQTCSQWMNLNLAGKHLVVVRFLERLGLTTRHELVNVFLPLLGLQQRPLLQGDAFRTRLQRRLQTVAGRATDALLNDAVSPHEAARLLRDTRES